MLSDEEILKASKWIKDNFGEEIEAALRGTRYNISIIIAIACQGIADRWLPWIEDFSIEEVLGRCITNSSGDYPGTHRVDFPKNESEFHDHYGDEITGMLVEEGNKMRNMPQPYYPKGYGSAHILYKSYGIFQYDLSHILEDSEFFLKKQWYNFNECFKRLMITLNGLDRKAKSHKDLWSILKAYSGSHGLEAIKYADNIFELNDIVNDRMPA